MEDCEPCKRKDLTSSNHGNQEIPDPVEEMLIKTGCINLHYKVQDCFSETKDWRKCQVEVTEFKNCMQKHQESRMRVKRLLLKMLRLISNHLQSKKMVIILRTDIKMGKGKIASQAAHAAVLLYQSSLETKNPHLKWWLTTGQPKIVLKVDMNCEEVLIETYQKAKDMNLNVCMVRDAGRTQVETGCLTAIGIGPNNKNDVDKITGCFKLL